MWLCLEESLKNRVEFRFLNFQNLENSLFLCRVEEGGGIGHWLSPVILKITIPDPDLRVRIPLPPPSTHTTSITNLLPQVMYNCNAPVATPVLQKFYNLCNSLLP
jgi:hypothetical protein